MKTTIFKFIILILFIFIVAATVVGCGANSNPDPEELSLKEQIELIKEWASKVDLGDSRSDVNKIIKDNPAIAEQLDEETLRELYVADLSDLEDVKKRWDETIIATIEKDLPSLQIGFTNDIVTTVIIRTNENKNAIVQKTKHSQEFDSEPDKERKKEVIDKSTDLYKKFDKISKELDKLWSKEETLSVEKFEEKFGEASFKTETGNRTEIVYLSDSDLLDSKKIESVDKLNELIRDKVRDFFVVIGNDTHGTFVADFKHLESVKRKENTGQTQVTSSHLIVNKARDLIEKKEAQRIRKQHTTK